MLGLGAVSQRWNEKMPADIFFLAKCIPEEGISLPDAIPSP
jgi:hypothetical protein